MTTPQQQYDAWLGGLTLDQIRGWFSDFGCSEVLVKFASNDNSKNQIYLGVDLAQVSKLPSGDVEASTTISRKPGATGRTKIQAPVDLHWISPSGPVPAPETKLIFYPQYPEVRLSGFLKRCVDPPRSLLVRELRGCDAGRILMLGVAGTRVYALILPPESPAARQLTSTDLEAYGALKIWRLTGGVARDPRAALLLELCRIHQSSWIGGKKIGADGTASPYAGQNAGGYTLEAELGVAPNGRAEPDFHGWEIKQHGVKNLTAPRHGPITLLTPEPDGGVYRTSGVHVFMSRWGYSSPEHRYRLDFAVRHRAGAGLNEKTNLQLTLVGHVSGAREFAADGYVGLCDASGEPAASWSFEKLLNHWKKKHAMTAFVPSESRGNPVPEYRYGGDVALAEGTTFLHFLEALHRGDVYYDPGINDQMQDDGTWRAHRRNQFRAPYAGLPSLYDRWAVVPVCS